MDSGILLLVLLAVSHVEALVTVLAKDKPALDADDSAVRLVIRQVPGAAAGLRTESTPRLEYKLFGCKPLVPMSQVNSFYIDDTHL